MGNNSNCEKNGSEDLFSTKFIRNWWYVAMGVILAFLIMQCCFSNELCMSKTPPYIGYIVLIVLILYPLYNSITAFGINVKKGMRELSGQIMNLNQMIQQNNKVIIKKKVIKYKTIIAKQEIHDKSSSANFKEKIEECENTTTKLDPQKVKNLIENQLKEIAESHFENYPFSEIEEYDLTDEILDDLVDISVIDQNQADILQKIISICDGWLVTSGISKEKEDELKALTKQGFEILELI